MPPDVTIRSASDYREGQAFSILASDCHNKCYICEDKPTTINVEHIVPHRSDPALKFDWGNLLIACGHCNNIKLAKYDDILDPTQQIKSKTESVLFPTADPSTMFSSIQEVISNRSRT